MRVLLVEDTPRLAEAVAEILRKGGYGADVAHTGADGLDLASTGAYDVVLLDIMLPDMSGMEVLRELRSAGGAVPVILLTARQGVGDRVAGLDAGADDYLPKPFHASELLARIRAVTRRPQVYRTDNVLEACGLMLDPSSHSLSIGGDEAAAIAVGGEAEVSVAGSDVDAPAASVELTPRESALLEVLMSRAGSPVSKRDLMMRLWGPNARAGENRIEVLVHALRDKLARLGGAARIETVRGVGYRLVAELRTGK